ncbi:GATA transcription factor 5 isoform X2 [Hevea brasiliensis]|uniref:GATA transcription factor 5 isoform X2 n=1 Tax=Hevea brasiliensis TaxID=3981 RepID=UPI0025E5066C|nr:GATA transcription factor 5 isoform X2 [Hevea brasiliensis]
MLYQTHHPFIFQFPSATTSSSHLQTQMECVEVALKASIRKEMALKFSPQVSFDDLWVPNMQNGASSDDSIVDELLDFSNEVGLIEEEAGEEKAYTVSVSPKEVLEDDKISEQSSNFSAKEYFGSVPASELGVPDDLASLEWLSHFVEDSNSEYSAPFPAGISQEKHNQDNLSGLQKPVLTEQCFKTPVPAKARSKRARTCVRGWPLGSPSLTESSSSSSSSSSPPCPPSSYLIFTPTGMNHEPTEPVFLGRPTAKKQKKRPAGELRSGVGGGSHGARRCSHCGVQKTPQWRTGPLGAKTLCNACGVRYKSGRLLPEYRPACSPTFSGELHSNHHRKVLEMRQKKGLLGQAEPDLAPAVVPSF